VLLSRRMKKEYAALGSSLFADLDLRQLFSVLPVSPVARLEARSDCGEIALQAVRRVAILNSETRAAVP
jgi:hypothetical protein